MIKAVTSARKSATDSPVVFLLYCTFALTGVLTALPGPLLPILLQQWHLSDSQGGSIIAAQFMAGVAGALFANQDRTRSLVMGLAFMAVGTLGLAYAAWPYLLMAVFGYGLGIGFAIPAINLKIAERNIHSRAASLSLLNCVWGIGAVSSTTLVFLAQRFFSIRTMLAMIGTVLIVLLIAVLRSLKALDFKPLKSHASLISNGGMRLALGSFAFLFFFYVGAETGIASWINVYAHRLAPERNLAFLAGAYFWIALLLGRLVAPIVLRWTSEPRLYFGSAFFALIGLVIILSAPSAAWVEMGAAVCGLAFAPVYPLLISFASSAMLAKPNSGWVFACASLGGAVIPWAVGIVSASYQLRLALLIPCLAMTLLFLAGIYGISRGNQNSPIIPR